MAERLTPKIFADTSDITEIKKLSSLGIIYGITTNPLIVAKQAGLQSPNEYYHAIAREFPQYPVSIQLLDEDVPTLIQQGKDFAAIAPNVVIKVPMFGDGKGLSVISALTSEGIKVNVTALMNAEQALIAMTNNGAEPTYLSLFFNRIRDGNGDPIQEIRRTRELLTQMNSTSQIITGSIRKPADVFEAVVAGTHIVTVQPEVIWKMVQHDQSDKFINQCQKQWNDFVAPNKSSS